MKQVSGSLTNYFYSYHAPLQSVIIVWILLMQNLPNLTGFTTFQLIISQFVLGNIIISIILYSGFYFNKISILHKTNDSYIIDDVEFSLSDLTQVIRIIPTRTGGSHQTRYKLKIATKKGFKHFKIIEKGHPMKLIPFSKNDTLEEFLKRNGLVCKVREEY